MRGKPGFVCTVDGLMSLASNTSSRGLAPKLETRIGGIIGRWALWLAVLGGLLLVALALLTIVSVVGRGASSSFGVLGPVRGDFELVIMGTAIAVFAFLPYAQYRRGHVAMEIATNWTSPHTKALLAMIADVLMTGAAFLIAWRLHAGLLDKIGNGETTFIVGIPTWLGYAGSAVGAWTMVAVSLYTVWRSLNEWLGGGEQ